MTAPQLHLNRTSKDPFASLGLTLVRVPVSGKRWQKGSGRIGLEDGMGWRRGEVGCSLSYGGALVGGLRRPGVVLSSVIEAGVARARNNESDMHTVQRYF